MAYMLFTRNDPNVPDDGNKWTKLSCVDTREDQPQGGEDPANGKFYWFNFTDRSKEALDAYLEDWNIKVSFNTLGGPSTQWRQRVDNLRVSTSGRGGFSEPSVEVFKQAFLAQFPGSDADISGQGVNNFQIVAVIGDYSEEKFEEYTRNYWLTISAEKRRWGMTLEGEAACLANTPEGTLTGTFDELSPFLQDRLST